MDRITEVLKHLDFTAKECAEGGDCCESITVIFGTLQDPAALAEYLNARPELAVDVIQMCADVSVKRALNNNGVRCHECGRGLFGNSVSVGGKIFCVDCGHEIFDRTEREISAAKPAPSTGNLCRVNMIYECEGKGYGSCPHRDKRINGGRCAHCNPSLGSGRYYCLSEQAQKEAVK